MVGHVGNGNSVWDLPVFVIRQHICMSPPVCRLMDMKHSIKGCGTEWLDMLRMVIASGMSLCMLSDIISVCRPQSVG